MQRLYCPTEHAILLVGVPDAIGVLRFPVTPDYGPAPGLHFAPRPLVSIDQQLVAEASRALGTDVALKLDLVQEFADELTLANGAKATIYLGTLVKDAGIAAAADWRSLPDLMRSMAKDRGRLPYLRAWQIMTGGLQLNTKALDLDVVKNHLLKT